MPKCETCEDKGYVYELCSICRGSGEGNHDGSICTVCKGLGERAKRCPDCDGGE